MQFVPTRRSKIRLRRRAASKTSKKTQLEAVHSEESGGFALVLNVFYIRPQEIFKCRRRKAICLK